MIGNPIALLGLIAVAVPIIIHLLGRHRSRIERFPTLRFIGTSRLNPTSRRRISDLAVLLARIGIVATAATALSQPWFAWEGRRADDAASSSVSRVVIVDTSASMMRLTPVGPAAALRAHEVADSLAAGVVSERVETDSPADAIAGAAAWLSTQPGRREIAIVSDFQSSSIDSTVLRDIPADVGVIAVAVPTTSVTVARAYDMPSIATLAGPSDLAGADASWRAVGRPRPSDTTGRIVIIYEGHPRAANLIAGAHRLDSSWMTRLVARLHRDRTLQDAAVSGPVLVAPTLDRVARGISAGSDGPRLLLFLKGAENLASAAMNQALLRAIDPAAPGSEGDTTTISAAELASWQRAASPAAGAGNSSDARWLWVLCLALVLLETWLRRQAPARVAGDSPVTEPVAFPDRAA